MNLYLIRHAMAVEAGTPEYDDSDRPLTDKGRKKMRQIARGLRKLGVEFDLILSSPYIRARETAEIVADVFKMKKKISFSENLIPTADPEVLLPEIIEKHAVENIALVGHEPHLSTLIGVLTSENKNLNIMLKKGGVCYLAADDLHHDEHRAALEWLLTPGMLVKIGDK